MHCVSKSWLQQTCGRYGWIHTKSPLIWRELVHRDGKPLLIGGANEFFEYVDAYYGIQSLLDSDHLMQVHVVDFILCAN